MQAAGFEDITELDAGRMGRGHFTRDQTIAPGNRAQKRHYTTGTEPTERSTGEGADEGTNGGTERTHTTVLLFSKGPRAPIPTRSAAPFRNESSFRLVSSARVCRSRFLRECVGEQLFAHRKTCGPSALHTLASALRTILQHCFLRRSITQRKFQAKIT